MANTADAPARGRARGIVAFIGLVALAALFARLTADVRMEREGRTRTSPTGLSAAPVRQAPPVVITEFLAINRKGLEDEDGDTPGWIELHNEGDEAVDLSGWTLSNTTRRPDAWTFPSVVIEAGAYLVVFASGKDRRDSNAPLHTNFELATDRGYLGVFPPDGVSESAWTFFPRYPRQTADVSFGTTETGLSYFDPPTPGVPPSGVGQYEGIVADLDFSVERGVHSRGVTLRLSTPTPGATVRYTLDGREPGADSGTLYRGGIAINKTTAVRVAAHRDGWISTPVETRTFVVPSSAAAQVVPDDYPDTWGEDLPADYELDPEMVRDARYSEMLTDAFGAIPSMSLVLDPKHLFDPETGIYVNTENDGVEWERPVSFEFMDPASGMTFQSNAGLRIHGRSSRKPMTSPKHSFRLLFKSKYGNAKLRQPLFGEGAAQKFDTLVLHATSNYSWTFPLVDQRERAQYVRDAWAKETQRAMGHAGSHTRYAHLYINGLYWGLYSISERPDANFMASYFGGRSREYDVRKGGETVDGDDRAWRMLLAMSARGFESDEAYAAAQELIDIDNFIDYLILNHYGGNENWDYGNWYAARRRAAEEKFRFFVWDMESILGRVGENSVFIRHRDQPTEIFHRLRENEAFRERFRDRVRLHLTGDGVLTPANAATRYERHANAIEIAIVAESARWGDYRKDVHPYRTGPFERYTRDQHWQAERNRLRVDYFPNRSANVLEQYRNAGLYSE